MVATHLELIRNEASVRRALNAPHWTVWARLPDRDDWRVYQKGVRTVHGVVQINAGEWSATHGYLNEEWVTPAMIYMVHQCAGCHYPPNMCCLQQGGPDDDGYDYMEDVFDSDAYDEGLSRLFSLPEGVTVKGADL